MATSTHYPLFALPWQEPYLTWDDSTCWTLTLVEDARWADSLAILYLEQSPAGWWRWEFYSCDPDRPGKSSNVFPYESHEAAEVGLLQCLALWLHTPPSRPLPSQEGAIDAGKGADCA